MTSIEASVTSAAAATSEAKWPPKAMRSAATTMPMTPAAAIASPRQGGGASDAGARSQVAPATSPEAKEQLCSHAPSTAYQGLNVLAPPNSTTCAGRGRCDTSLRTPLTRRPGPSAKLSTRNRTRRSGEGRARARPSHSGREGKASERQHRARQVITELAQQDERRLAAQAEAFAFALVETARDRKIDLWPNRGHEHEGGKDEHGRNRRGEGRALPPPFRLSLASSILA